MCQCDSITVTNVENSFKKFLQEQHSLEEWKDWLEAILDQSLQLYEDSAEKYSKAARNFLLKWSFYRSVNDLILPHHSVQYIKYYLIRTTYKMLCSTMMTLFTTLFL